MTNRIIIIILHLFNKYHGHVKTNNTCFLKIKIRIYSLHNNVKKKELNEVHHTPDPRIYSFLATIDFYHRQIFSVVESAVLFVTECSEMFHRILDGGSPSLSENTCALYYTSIKQQFKYFCSIN
jgi:hypothetical protein